MKSKNITTFVALAIALIALTLWPASVHAQATDSTGSFNIVRCGNSDNLNNSGAKEASDACTLQDLFDTGIRIINLLMVAAGVFATIRIVFAGAQMVLSAGNEEALAAGKSGLSNAILGLVIVIISFLVINTLVTFLVPGGEGILRDPLQFIKGGNQTSAPPTTGK